MALSLIVDGTNHLHCDWYARKESKAAIRTLLDRLLRFQMELRPDRFVVCFDSPVSFRKDLAPSYKASRNGKELGLTRALAMAPESLMEQGIDCLTVEGFEADDLLATFATIDSQRDEWKVILSSKDKDLRQCLRDGRINQMISWQRSHDHFAFSWFTEKKLCDQFKVTPQQWIEVQTLHGDPGDDVPGVEGVGEVTALKLVREFGLDAIRANPFLITNARIRERVRQFFASGNAEITRQLVTLVRDVPLPAAWCDEVLS